jgi:ubiquinone/menaquinone biosynthesis C-methylase UbiE
MSDLVKNIAHKIVAQPIVYDALQITVGVSHVQQRIAAHIPQLAAGAHVLDVGGGTGIQREQFATRVNYTCLDIDRQKLDGFRAKFAGDTALLSDGTRMALQSGSIDFGLCVFVMHHVPDALISDLIGECARVLKRGGTFLFIDPLWRPQRPIGRLLWRYDRGSYPRTETRLAELIGAHFADTQWEYFAVMHAYGLCVARHL